MDLTASAEERAKQDLARRIACVRRLVQDARMLQRSGIWLSVEEVEAALAGEGEPAPPVGWTPT
jgi:hypothetical protein